MRNRTMLFATTIILFIVSCKHNSISSEENGFRISHNAQTGKFGYKDSLGNTITPEQYSIAEPFDTIGYALVGNESGKKGVINTKGIEIIPVAYDKIEVLGNNSFLVYNENNGKQKVGLFHDGELRIPVGYERLRILNDTYIIFTQGGYEGIVTFQNKEIVPPVYQEIDTILYNRYFFGKEDNKFKLININNNTIIEHGRRDTVMRNLTVTRNSKGCCFFDLKKSEKPIYSNINYYSIEHNFLLLGKSLGDRKTEVYVVDNKGKFLFEKTDDISIVGFSEDKFVFYRIEEKESSSSIGDNLKAIKHRFGFLSKEGNIFIPPIYDKAEPFEDGKAKVTYNNRTFFIDSSGKCVEDCPSKKWFAHYAKKEFLRCEYHNFRFELNKLFSKNGSVFEVKNKGLTEIAIRFDSLGGVGSEYQYKDIDEIITDVRSYALESTEILKRNFSDTELLDYGYEYIDGQKVIWVKQETDEFSPKFTTTIESLFIFTYPKVYTITISYKSSIYNKMLVRNFINSIEID